MIADAVPDVQVIEPEVKVVAATVVEKQGLRSPLIAAEERLANTAISSRCLETVLKS